jgi:hypothetical protein
MLNMRRRESLLERFKERGRDSGGCSEGGRARVSGDRGSHLFKIRPYRGWRMEVLLIGDSYSTIISVVYALFQQQLRCTQQQQQQ